MTINARSVHLDSCHLPAFDPSMLKVCGFELKELRLSDDMKCVPYSCKTGDGTACKICKVQGERTGCRLKMPISLSQFWDGTYSCHPVNHKLELLINKQIPGLRTFTR